MAKRTVKLSAMVICPACRGGKIVQVPCFEKVKYVTCDKCKGKGKVKLERKD